MKLFLYFIFLTLLGFFILKDLYGSIAFGVTMCLVVNIIIRSNESFVFREWALLLYAVNYLLSPALTYYFDSIKVTYAMKIASKSYFSLALPGFFLFAIGMFSISSKIFKMNFIAISKITVVNERFLINLSLFGFICSLTSGFYSTNFAFFVYLVSLIRFVGVFALFASNPTKYKYFVFFILVFELYNGFKNALFHDAIMWLIFFALFYIYLRKPTLILKMIGAFSLIAFVLLIQAFKGDYRDRVWKGGEANNFETISAVGLENANSENLIGEDNLTGTLNRGNQAWIFASTVDNMDRTNDFQGLSNVRLYLESALLPRFLAPNKITAGNRLIFNQFSGHQIEEGTSMGLGVFADGYIAYGNWGVFVFTFVLGLIFSLTFKLVEGWSNISPFYSLMILPMLNYAVRPDCELQTTINHLAKSIIVFGSLVYLTKYRFTLASKSTTIFQN